MLLDPNEAVELKLLDAVGKLLHLHLTLHPILALLLRLLEGLLEKHHPSFSNLLEKLTQGIQNKYVLPSQTFDRSAYF